ncbi:hypothetical protein FWG76_01450 [Candidatus Saccharibacteria bacterium]|nr:hypothetical protein [Candidatus Saccharibacteria bacterium]
MTNADQADSYRGIRTAEANRGLIIQSVWRVLKDSNSNLTKAEIVALFEQSEVVGDFIDRLDDLTSDCETAFSNFEAAFLRGVLEIADEFAMGKGISGDNATDA